MGGASKTRIFWREMAIVGLEAVETKTIQVYRHITRLAEIALAAFTGFDCDLLAAVVTDMS